MLENLNKLEAEKTALKLQLASLDEQIKEEQGKISPQIIFADGKKTGYFKSGDLRLKEEKKESIAWNQDMLNKARASLGDETFLAFFKFEWKHSNKGAIDTFIKTPQGKIILDAMTIKTSSTFTLEKVAGA